MSQRAVQVTIAEVVQLAAAALHIADVFLNSTNVLGPAQWFNVVQITVSQADTDCNSPMDLN